MEPLANQAGHARRWMIAGRQQNIAGLDSRAFTGAVRRNSLRFQAAMRLHPPDAIRGLLKLRILDEVQPSKDDRGESKQRQRYHGKPG